MFFLEFANGLLAGYPAFTQSRYAYIYLRCVYKLCSQKNTVNAFFEPVEEKWPSAVPKNFVTKSRN